MLFCPVHGTCAFIRRPDVASSLLHIIRSPLIRFCSVTRMSCTYNVGRLHKKSEHWWNMWIHANVLWRKRTWLVKTRIHQKNLQYHSDNKNTYYCFAKKFTCSLLTFLERLQKCHMIQYHVRGNGQRKENYQHFGLTNQTFEDIRPVSLQFNISIGHLVSFV